MEKIRKLVGETRSYIADYGIDASAEIAIKALGAYVEFNRAAAADIQEVPAAVETLQQALVTARGARSANATRAGSMAASSP